MWFEEFLKGLDLLELPLPGLSTQFPLQGYAYYINFQVGFCALSKAIQHWKKKSFIRVEIRSEVCDVCVSPILQILQSWETQLISFIVSVRSCSISTQTFMLAYPPLVIFYEIKPQYSGHWYVQICVICNVIGVNDLRWCNTRDGSFSHCVMWNDGITVYSSGKCWNNLSEPRDKHGF